MPRTTRQLQAYCKHAIGNGTPRNEIISELLSQELDRDAADQMYSHFRKAARKSALVIITIGIILEASSVGLAALALSAGGIPGVWVFFPLIVGFVLICVGLSQLIKT